MPGRPSGDGRRPDVRRLAGHVPALLLLCRLVGEYDEADMLPQFVVFGDSIVQDASSPERGFAFAAALQHAYIRRLDVVNRGLRYRQWAMECLADSDSGYNTDQALAVLPHVIPPPHQARVRFLVCSRATRCLP